jgi:hypothetical protein
LCRSRGWSWFGIGWCSGDNRAWRRIRWLLRLLDLLFFSFLGSNFWCWNLLNLGGSNWRILGLGRSAIGGWRLLDNWLGLNSLLELLRKNISIQSRCNRFLDSSLSLWHLNIFNERASGSSLLLSALNSLLFTLLVYVSEDVVQNEVASRLLCEDKGLDEFLEFGGFVRCFTDNLYDDVVE